MPERAPHYVSLSVAILAGFWAALEAPATRLFEQTMRSLDITGQVLGPLDLLSDSIATLVVMALVYVASTEVMARLGFTSEAG